MSARDNDAKPWDPLDLELDEDGAYHHFCIFRDLPPGERSVTEVHRISGSDVEISRVRRWSREFEWRRRASAYDARCADIRRRAREEALQAQADFGHYKVLAGFYMTQAGVARAAQLRRAPEEIHARDLPGFVKTGLELLQPDASAQAKKIDLSKLSPEDLDDLDRIMRKAEAGDGPAERADSVASETDERA